MNPFFYRSRGFIAKVLFLSLIHICIGVFADQAEINASPKQFNDNTQPGDLKYKDISGPDGKPDGVIDNYDRRTFSGRFPGFEYGINASATWKGFDLSLIGQGVADKKYYTTDWGCLLYTSRCV